MTKEKSINVDKMHSHAKEAELYIKQFANKTRLMVMCSLLEQELSVSDLLGQIPVTQPVLSQHLALLREANMVTTRREGQTIFYRLDDRRIRQTIHLLYDFFCH